jgi:hypothetical protein
VITSETAAAERAAAHAAEHFADLGPREWRGSRFAGGWLMDPVGDDLSWQCGVVCLAVLDDGRIFEDSSSEPPDQLKHKYAALAVDPSGEEQP